MRTLNDVVDGAERGLEWRERYDERQRQRQIRDKVDAANAEGARVIDEWRSSQPQAPKVALSTPAAGEVSGAAPVEPTLADARPAPAPPAAPDQSVLLRALEARGNALAKAGLLDEFTKNYAQMAPLRMQMRKQAMDGALQQYQMDGDVGRLAQTAFNSVDTGRRVTKVVAGKDMRGGPDAPEMYRFVLDDGTTTPATTKEKLLEAVQRMQLDPQKTAEFEFQANLKKAAELATIQARGEEDRKTNENRVTGQLSLANAQHANRVEELGLTNASRETVANIRADATKTSARVRAAGGGSGGGDGGKKVQKTITGDDGYVVNVFKDGTSGRLLIDGKPVKAGEYGKRVDSIVNQLRKSSSGFGKSETELRRMAEDSLATGDAPKPSAGGKDFSGLWGAR